MSALRIAMAAAAAFAFHAAAPATQTPAAEKASASADGDKLICRKQQPPSGTRIGPTRVCATATEWQMRDEMTQETRRNIDKVQQQRAY
ncbi:hypothetical protein [Allosphingosinicella indica]|uniref:Secreted protein n=1 Tax=Allosphingosinicella indica TaxID=941907 RepID=A0A1X7H0B9_9SPHN|nr:hypothetical protein [Allosphingosinicella indica]SMF77406.1 hypothetical protein SAMN06295910_2585 [Allosphingosinicella indica]